MSPQECERGAFEPGKKASLWVLGHFMKWDILYVRWRLQGEQGQKDGQKRCRANRERVLGIWSGILGPDGADGEEGPR